MTVSSFEHTADKGGNDACQYTLYSVQYRLELGEAWKSVVPTAVRVVAVEFPGEV